MDSFFSAWAGASVLAQPEKIETMAAIQTKIAMVFFIKIIASKLNRIKKCNTSKPTEKTAG